MSIATVSDQGLIYKPFPLFHRRNDSGELDVFEAAGYFSGYIEATGGSFNGGSCMQKIAKEESKSWRGRTRMSLDMSIETIVSEQSFNGCEKQVKGKKFKQPSSPGGKLASFLNSLFNQTVSKKKKKTMKSSADEEGSPGSGRRKRRSSISHFPSSNAIDSKSMSSSSTSAFRSPFLFVQTPTKNYKEFKENVTILKHSAKPDASAEAEEKRKKDSSLMEEKMKFRIKKNAINVVSGKDQKMDWREKYQKEETKFFKNEGDDDDGGDSDSSSDLFELQIKNFDHCSSNDLPVYETTKLGKIRRGNLASANVY